MRFPYKVPENYSLSSAFSNEDSEATIGLSVLTCSDIFLFINEQQEKELLSCGRGVPKIEVAIEKLRENSICVTSESWGNSADTTTPLPANLAENKGGNRGLIKLPVLLSNSTFRENIEKYNAALISSESPEVAFKRIFERHLARATNITLIDPWFAQTIWFANSNARKLFDNLVIGLNRSVTVCTQIPFKRNQVFEFEYAGRKRQIDGKNRFLEFLKSEAQAFANLMHPTSELCIDFYEKNGFPHDRHLEVIFPDGSRKLGRADYFALGSGFDTFGSKNLDKATGKVRAQIYQSDWQRMWGWKMAERPEHSINQKEWSIRVRISPGNKVAVEVMERPSRVSSW